MPVTTRSRRQRLRPLQPVAAHSYHLPSDIIDHILLRLPSRSLLRFRCVCKSWSALISDPKFVQSHHGQSQASIYRTKLLFRHQWRGNFWAVCADDDKETSIENLYFPGNHNFEILCSCDGLVMMKEQTRKPSHMFYLWNPSVRKYMKISYPSHLTIFDHSRIDQGLCYDSSTNDYNIVLIHHSSNSSRYLTYSVEKDSWSESKFYPYSELVLSSDNAFVNGVLHWVASRGNRIINGIYYPEYVNIIGFKPEEENFSVYPLPKSVILHKKRDWDCYLTVLDGYLGLFTYSCSSRSMRIWLRTGQDYNDTSSWKSLIILLDLPVPDASMLVRPLYYVGDNELLLYIEEGRLLLFDIEEDDFLEMDGVPNSHINMGKFIDSLLLPGIGGNTRKRWLTTEKRGRTIAGKVRA